MSETKGIRRYFGGWDFYKKAARLAVPSMLQQVLSSAMGMVDTMMVSAIGMVTPVGIGSQIGNLSNNICFGVMEGTGTYASQFFGAKDEKNLQRTFGLSLLLNVSIGLLFFTAVSLFPIPIIRFYVKNEEVISNARIYLSIVKFSFPLACCSLAFNYFYRCIHKTTVSMFIGITSMATNVVVNYLTIYGKFGISPMGVKGAALGTLLASCMSFTLYLTYSLFSKAPFLGPLKNMLAIDLDFFQKVMNRTYPTIFNETLFGFGTSLYVKAYSLLGTNVTDAYYVANTITNMFFAVCNGMSVAGSMLLGAELGKGNVDDAITQSRWFLSLGMCLSAAIAVIIMLLANPLVSLFGLSDADVIALARGIVRVSSVRISLRMVVVVIFSALRAGGDSRFLAILDCGIVWCVGIPLIYGMIALLKMDNFVLIYLLAQAELAVRIFIGLKRFRSNLWAINLTTEI